jgi:ATP-dependent DNA ligase
MKLITFLAKHSSKLTKAEALKKATELDKQVLKAAYSPYATYGVTFDHFDFDNLGEPNNEMFSLLAKLAGRLLTGNAARAAVQAYAKAHGDLIKLICNKDLRCGIRSTAINNIFPGLIPEFKVQLAVDAPIESATFPMLAQIKYDGVRIVILNSNGIVQFRTRNGLAVHLPKLTAFLEQQPQQDYMLDTEVTLLEDKANRTGISGYINSAIHGNTVPEHAFRFNVFDGMSYTQFTTAFCSIEYSLRKSFYTGVLKKWQSDQFIPAHTELVLTPAEANDYFDALTEQGWEGLILKPINHAYRFKRSKEWLKMKEIHEADLLCVDVIEGTGRYEGAIGALTCTGIVGNKLVTVNVGSGLTDADRVKPVETYLGKTIEVKYNSVIQGAASANSSLFLPRFSRVRFDK